MSVVLYEKRGKIAYITINRPGVLNAISREVLESLAQVWIKVRDDSDVWAAIVTGAGDKAFSAGADLKELAQLRTELGKEGVTGSKFPEITPIRGLEVWKPFIAAINGYCLAGG